MAILFLLNPNFKDTRISDTDAFYCPHCAMIEGVLHYYPQLREAIEIAYVDFQRPRHKIIDLIGEENQGCPCLILHRSELEYSAVDIKSFTRYGDYLFVNTTTGIAKYLAERYAIGLPHP